MTPKGVVFRYVQTILRGVTFRSYLEHGTKHDYNDGLIKEYKRETDRIKIPNNRNKAMLGTPPMYEKVLLLSDRRFHELFKDREYLGVIELLDGYETLHFSGSILGVTYQTEPLKMLK